MKYKIIAIIGEAGCGKDTILNSLYEKNPKLHKIISCTTRPARDYEIFGEDYYFLTNEDFAKRVLNGDMLEATIFNEWCYGTSKQALKQNSVNIGVFNPAGVTALMEEKEVDLKVYRLKVSEKERLKRQLNREVSPNVDEIIRRLYADRADFEDLPFSYVDLPNEYNYQKEIIIQTIINDIKNWT